MTRFSRLFLPALALCVWGATSPSLADTSPAFDASAALSQSQAVIGRKLGDHRFVSSEGKPVRLADYAGKPFIISLIYSSCYHTCPQITQSLARAVEVAGDALGAEKFEVITVGFDTDYDKPSAMRSFARAQGIDFDNWRFLSADAPTIWRLSDDTGFRFAPSPRGFDHLTQTTIIDREGRVYAHVYGDDFPTPQLVEPLKQLVLNDGPWNSLQTFVDRVRFICTSYDPARDAYYFDYSLFIGMTIGFICLLALSIFIYREFFRHRRSPTARKSVR
jgi:protein SCO1/2